MPRKREFRRLRRVLQVRLVSQLGIGLGVISTVQAAGDAMHHRPGGAEGVLICPMVVALGVAGVSWTRRTAKQAAADDRSDLDAQGLYDGLPMGVFIENGRMGLEASDFYLVGGAILLVVAAFLGVLGTTGPYGSWQGAAGISLVGVVPAVLFFRTGKGTKYWLTTERIEATSRSHRSVRWADVQRVVLLDRGLPTQDVGFAKAFELRTAEPQGGVRGWLSPDFVIPVQAVQVDATTLLAMIGRLTPQAMDKRGSGALASSPRPRLRSVPARVRSADRRLVRFVVLMTVAGIAVVAVGVGSLMLSSPPEWKGSARGDISSYAFVAIGLACLGAPWIEVARRLRRGPSERGQHTRS